MQRSSKRPQKREVNRQVSRSVDTHTKSMKADCKELNALFSKEIFKLAGHIRQLMTAQNLGMITIEMVNITATINNGKIYVGIPAYNPAANPKGYQLLELEIIKGIKKVLRKNDSYLQLLTANGRREYSIHIFDASAVNANYAMKKISDGLCDALAVNLSVSSIASLSKDKVSKLYFLHVTLNNYIFDLKSKELTVLFPKLAVFHRQIKNYNDFPELMNYEYSLLCCYREVEDKSYSIEEVIRENSKIYRHYQIDPHKDFSSQWDNSIASIIAANNLLESGIRLLSSLDKIKDALKNLEILLEECKLQFKKCIALEDVCGRWESAFSGISIQDRVLLLGGNYFLATCPDMINLNNIKNDYLAHITALNTQIAGLSLGLEKLSVAQCEVTQKIKDQALLGIDSIPEKTSIEKVAEPIHGDDHYVDNINQPSLKVTTKRAAEKKIEREERRDELKANRGYHLYSFAVDPGFNPTANDNKPEENNENIINLVITIKDKNLNNERQVNVTAIRLGKTQSLYMVCEDVIHQRETDECHAFLEVCKRNKVLPKDSLGVNGLKEWGDSGSFVAKSKKHTGSHLVLHPCVVANYPDKTVYLPAEIVDHDYYEAQYQNKTQIQENGIRAMKGIIVREEVELVCQVRNQPF